MNNLQVFENEEFGKIRMIMKDATVWFIGKDVATVLGYKEPTKAVREKVDSEDRGVSKIDTPSGTQEMTIINESGLYSLILSSKLLSAKKFKHWVTSEVLPSIRKIGGYQLSEMRMYQVDKLLASRRYGDASLHDVVQLLKVLRATMIGCKQSPHDVFRMVQHVCYQFSINLPADSGR